MQIETFELERWQSLHEHRVEVNLSDSGIHPMTLRELIGDGPELEALLDERLIYTQTNGTEALRAAAAELYPGAGTDHLTITSGGSEANYVATWALVEPGDEVVVMQPNYQQIQGLVPSLGATLRPWRIEPDLENQTWTVDLERLESLVNDKTRLIAICNPNNPTGRCLSESELDAIARIAERHGTWILSDEVYRGSERSGRETPTLFGRTERVVVTSSLSKSYGLPGLRLGWVATTPELAEECWKRHDYTSIAPNALSDRVGQYALRADVRERVLARTHERLLDNYGRVRQWLASQPSLRSIPPQAGAIAWFQYDLDITSDELAQRLLDEQSVLVVPGSQFGLEGWMRIGFGVEPEELEDGLARVGRVLQGFAT